MKRLEAKGWRDEERSGRGPHGVGSDRRRWRGAMPSSGHHVSLRTLGREHGRNYDCPFPMERRQAARTAAEATIYSRNRTRRGALTLTIRRARTGTSSTVAVRRSNMRLAQERAIPILQYPRPSSYSSLHLPPMPTISRILQALEPSATLAMAAKAKELSRAGKKVYDFSVGEPDFVTPAIFAKRRRRHARRAYALHRRQRNPRIEAGRRDRLYQAARIGLRRRSGRGLQRRKAFAAQCVHGPLQSGR